MRRLLLLYFLLAAWPQNPATAQPLIMPVTTHSLPAQLHFVQGREFVHFLHYERAYDQLLLAVRADTSFALAYAYLAWAATQLEQDASPALATAQRLTAQASVPEQTLIDILQEALYASSSNMEKRLQALIRDYPDDAYLRHLLWRIQYGKEQYDEADRTMNTLLKNFPAFAPAHYSAGLATLLQSSPDQAHVHFNFLQQTLPDHSVTYSGWGEYFLQLGQYEKAIENFARAESLSPTTAQEPLRIAEACFLAGQCQKAAEAYRKTMERATRYPDRTQWDVKLRLAFAQLGARHFDRAASLLIEIQHAARRQNEPETQMEALRYLAWARLLEGDTAAVRQVMQRHETVRTYADVERYDDQNARAYEHFFAGLLALQGGNHEGAMTCAHRLRALVRTYYAYDETPHLDAFLSGQIAEARKEWPEAAREYEKLTSRGPYFLALLARVYRELGREEDERRCLAQIQANQTIDFGLAAYWATREK